MSDDWSKEEVTLIVEDHFAMLRQDLQGHAPNKAEHRRGLLPLLAHRSEGSIEFKHQNISAVLVNLGQPYIRGYKPRSNYQGLLEEVVIEFLERSRSTLEPLFEAFVEQPLSTLTSSEPDYASCLETAPARSHASAKAKKTTFKTVKINYLEREQRNRVLGAAGEQFVIGYERWRLTKAGREDLASQIKWISKDKGDGAGYDILSKNEDGSDRFIEVKTTKLSKETPIYLTPTEIVFAAQHAPHFYLYRVFDLEKSRKLFIRQGDYEGICDLTPLTYKGTF